MGTDGQCANAGQESVEESFEILLKKKKRFDRYKIFFLIICMSLYIVVHKTESD